MTPKNFSLMFDMAESTYYKWIKEHRPIMFFLNQYFTDEDIEEFLTNKKISRLENLIEYKIHDVDFVLHQLADKIDVFNTLHFYFIQIHPIIQESNLILDKLEFQDFKMALTSIKDYNLKYYQDFINKNFKIKYLTSRFYHNEFLYKITMDVYTQINIVLKIIDLLNLPNQIQKDIYSHFDNLNSN